MNEQDVSLVEYLLSAFGGIEIKAKTGTIFKINKGFDEDRSASFSFAAPLWLDHGFVFRTITKYFEQIGYGIIASHRSANSFTFRAERGMESIPVAIIIPPGRLIVNIMVPKR